MFASVTELEEALRESGYIADPVTVTTVFLAAALHRPVLLEGPAGSGKTQLAYAVAEAAHSKVERLQCYEGINEEKAIGRFDESLQRLFVQYQAQSTAINWDELAFVLQNRRFFSAGPLLLALEYEKPCVLLIDELDKVDHAFEAMLLELLSIWQLSVPKLGTMQVRSIPFVVLTSNEEPRIGDPLRRRSFYLRIEHPTPEREAKILQLRTPHASPEFHVGMAGLANTSIGGSNPLLCQLEIPLSQMLSISYKENLRPEGESVYLTRTFIVPFLRPRFLKSCLLFNNSGFFVDSQ